MDDEWKTIATRMTFLYLFGFTLEKPRDFTQPVVVRELKIWAQEKFPTENNNYVISAVSSDGPAVLVAQTSAATAMTNAGCCGYLGGIGIWKFKIQTIIFYNLWTLFIKQNHSFCIYVG